MHLKSFSAKTNFWEPIFGDYSDISILANI